MKGGDRHTPGEYSSGEPERQPAPDIATPAASPVPAAGEGSACGETPRYDCPHHGEHPDCVCGRYVSPAPADACPYCEGAGRLQGGPSWSKCPRCYGSGKAEDVGPRNAVEAAALILDCNALICLLREARNYIEHLAWGGTSTPAADLLSRIDKEIGNG